MLPEELRVIEAYLATLLDESFEQMALETDKATARRPNAMWNSNDIDKYLLAAACVIAKMGCSEIQGPNP